MNTLPEHNPTAYNHSEVRCFSRKPHLPPDLFPGRSTKRAILPVLWRTPDEEVLLAWRTLTWDGPKANYTYAQPDALIAATALVHELGVVTRNTDDLVRAGVTLLNPWAGAES